MKTLIVEALDHARIAELVGVSRVFGDRCDIVVLGDGLAPGEYEKAYSTSEAIAPNLIAALEALIKKQAYEIILLSATSIGYGLAGPLSVRLQASFLSEVTGVSPDLVVERPLYGGKALARYKINRMPAILTIRRNYFEKAELRGMTPVEPLLGVSGQVRLLAEHEEKTDGIPLEDAQVIVSGGRGIGAVENFSMLKELANLFKGAVGASRGAVDEGWMSPQHQVGQTGKIVAPQVYFAVGISGASQHLAGIANAKCVVAINKDEEANIYKRARYGIVGDYKKVVPELIKAMKAES